MTHEEFSAHIFATFVKQFADAYKRYAKDRAKYEECFHVYGTIWIHLWLDHPVYGEIVPPFIFTATLDSLEQTEMSVADRARLQQAADAYPDKVSVFRKARAAKFQ